MEKISYNLAFAVFFSSKKVVDPYSEISNLYTEMQSEFLCLTQS